MKNCLYLIFSLFFISLFTSCSKDDINQNSNWLGVWEKNDFNENSKDTFRLVFGLDNTGLRINTIELTSGEMISTATDFNWNVNNNIIRLSGPDISEANYIISPEGQLVLVTSEDLRLDKVSDDYSKYY